MASELVDVLRHLIADAPHIRSVPSIAAWWKRHEKEGARYSTNAARAFAGGFSADRLGYAFASGYQEALGALVPPLMGVRSAFCITEAGGTAPSAIDTHFVLKGDAYEVSGHKTHVTLGVHAEELLIVGHIGLDDHERRRICVARIPASREGVELIARPDYPFAPEIPHAELSLTRVRVSLDEVLEGDGYDEYVKPFRTTEDLHVAAAIVGYLMRVGRLSGWGPAELEALTAFAAAIFPLCLVDPLDAAVHVAVGGIQRRLAALIESLPWNAVEPTVRTRFKRDLPIMHVAGKASERRLRVAWRRLNG